MSARDDVMASFEALLRRAEESAPDALLPMRELLDAAIDKAADARAACDPAEQTVAGWHGIIGESEVMLHMRSHLEKFAKANAPILITGESGTGKERVAQAVHEISRRSEKSFVAENCAAIPATLLESVLFGHKRGSFTGAIQDHPGHFLSAHKGTLFLDEIGEMPMALQAKLLRTLQEGEVRAVGDNKVRKVDVRVIAATNQNIEESVKKGSFREDLYFRLNVLRLDMPPLRDRGDDILLLARQFLADACVRSGRELRLTDEVEQALLTGKWPGNVRQLQNEMQRLSALSEGPVVKLGELSPELNKK